MGANWVLVGIEAGLFLQSATQVANTINRISTEVAEEHSVAQVERTPVVREATST
jgi:hypothetical protein